MAYLLINYPQSQEEYHFFESGSQSEELLCEPIVPNIFLFTKEKYSAKTKPDFMKSLKETSDRLKFNVTLNPDNDFIV